MALTLLDAAAKSFLLLVVTTIICFAQRRSSAATRHLVWVSSLGMVLLLPALLLLLPPARILPGWLSLTHRTAVRSIPEPVRPQQSMLVSNRPIAPNALRERDTLPTEEVDPVSPTVSRAAAESPATEKTFGPVQRGKNNWSPEFFLLLAWGCGSTVLLVPLMFGTWASLRLSRAFPAMTDGKLVQATNAIARELRITPPCVHLGPVGAMPMVWGSLRGHLLLPDDAATRDGFPLRAVLLHELAHLRRRDPLTMVIGQFARAVYWFNPLAWLAVSRMRIERERACDDDVLRSGMKPSDYAAS
ncbi:MAG: antirepressor regulating drug resistance protein, partial [Planctomycetaceae bacterium]|nr:antirepressor regulating drug resistance protein [Planctomycetaceae bacterium]